MTSPVKAHFQANTYCSDKGFDEAAKINQLVEDVENNLNHIGDALKTRFRKLVISQLSLLKYREPKQETKSVNGDKPGQWSKNDISKDDHKERSSLTTYDDPVKKIENATEEIYRKDFQYKNVKKPLKRIHMIDKNELIKVNKDTVDNGGVRKVYTKEVKTTRGNLDENTQSEVMTRSPTSASIQSEIYQKQYLLKQQFAIHDNHDQDTRLSSYGKQYNTARSPLETQLFNQTKKVQTLKQTVSPKFEQPTKKRQSLDPDQTSIYRNRNYDTNRHSDKKTNTFDEEPTYLRPTCFYPSDENVETSPSFSGYFRIQRSDLNSPPRERKRTNDIVNRRRSPTTSSFQSEMKLVNDIRKRPLLGRVDIENDTGQSASQKRFKATSIAPQQIEIDNKKMSANARGNRSKNVVKENGNWRSTTQFNTVRSPFDKEMLNLTMKLQTLKQSVSPQYRSPTTERQSPKSTSYIKNSTDAKHGAYKNDHSPLNVSSEYGSDTVNTLNNSRQSQVSEVSHIHRRDEQPYDPQHEISLSPLCIHKPTTISFKQTHKEDYKTMEVMQQVNGSYCEKSAKYNSDKPSLPLRQIYNHSNKPGNVNTNTLYSEYVRSTPDEIKPLTLSNGKKTVVFSPTPEHFQNEKNVLDRNTPAKLGHEHTIGLSSSRKQFNRVHSPLEKQMRDFRNKMKILEESCSPTFESTATENRSPDRIHACRNKHRDTKDDHYSRDRPYSNISSEYGSDLHGEIDKTRQKRITETSHLPLSKEQSVDANSEMSEPLLHYNDKSTTIVPKQTVRVDNKNYTAINSVSGREKITKCNKGDQSTCSRQPYFYSNDSGYVDTNPSTSRYHKRNHDEENCGYRQRNYQNNDMMSMRDQPYTTRCPMRSDCIDKLQHPPYIEAPIERRHTKPLETEPLTDKKNKSPRIYDGADSKASFKFDNDISPPNNYTYNTGSARGTNTTNRNKIQAKQSPKPVNSVFRDEERSYMDNYHRKSISEIGRRPNSSFNEHISGTKSTNYQDDPIDYRLEEKQEGNHGALELLKSVMDIMIRITKDAFSNITDAGHRAAIKCKIVRINIKVDELIAKLSTDKIVTQDVCLKETENMLRGGLRTAHKGELVSNLKSMSFVSGTIAGDQLMLSELSHFIKEVRDVIDSIYEKRECPYTAIPEWSYPNDAYRSNYAEQKPNAYMRQVENPTPNPPEVIRTGLVQHQLKARVPIPSEHTHKQLSPLTAKPEKNNTYAKQHISHNSEQMDIADGFGQATQYPDVYDRNTQDLQNKPECKMLYKSNSCSACDVSQPRVRNADAWSSHIDTQAADIRTEHIHPNAAGTSTRVKTHSSIGETTGERDKVDDVISGASVNSHSICSPLYIFLLIAGVILGIVLRYVVPRFFFYVSELFIRVIKYIWCNMQLIHCSSPLV